ncbi:MAG: MBOAT family protein [Actinobacteria bacterium]|nr:MBOAT family protein [Actinomycetota bacterium]
MLFPTVSFAAFFLVVFIVSWLLMPRFTWWKLFMIAASYFFYATWDWKFCFLLVAATVINQAGALLVTHARSGGARKAWMAATVAADLLILGFFKYYGFFVVSTANVLDAVGLGAPLPLIKLVLPVGISFLTFRVITYVVEVYRGHSPPAATIDVALYVSFFPYLLAGPIVRARELLPQLAAPRDPRRIDVGRAAFLIFAGLVKKILIADYIAASIVNDAFASPGDFSSFEVLVAVLGYSVQIYCDFSAYSDIAIGTALLLGFRFPDNFNAPYTALSIRDFWRRWHITLSTWLRDYLYIPLGGNRKGRLRTYVNLMITMLLGGLWHGAGWTFIFWGGLHGVGLVGEHAAADRRTALGMPEREAGLAGRVLRRTWVFAFVTFAWIFFRADTMGAAWRVIGRLFTGWGAPSPAVTWQLLTLIFLGVAIQYVPRRVTLGIENGFARLGPVLQGLAVALGLFLIGALGPQGPALFLYFRF